MAINKLSDYGYSFQSKLIACLITDKAFLQTIIEILKSDYFESEANQVLMKIIKKYFLQYKQLPTLEVLKVEIENIENDILRTQVVENLKNAWQSINSTDLIYTKEKALEFCKNQALKTAIEDSVDLLMNGKYEEIKLKIDTALKAGQGLGTGYDYKNDVITRYTDETRFPVELPWEPISAVMDGGLAAGELGVLVGGPGAGKSYALQNLAYHAVKKGKRVIFFTLELDAIYTAKRFDTIATGIESRNLKYHVDDIISTINKLPGELILEYYPDKSATTLTLRNFIDKCILLDKKPDLVIIDYADKLAYTNRGYESREDQILGGIYTDLRGMAGELRIPIWTASQSKRAAAEKEVITGEDIAASYEKVMIADFVMSLARRVDDKIGGTGRWLVIKNRFGPDGITYPSKIDFSIGKISIFEPDSLDGKETRKNMGEKGETGITARKYLGSRYKELMEEE